MLTYFRSLWKYARYFAKRHPKVVEDEKAVEIVIRLEEEATSAASGIGRRLTVRTVGARSPAPVEGDEAISPLHRTETGVSPGVSPLQRNDTGILRIITHPEPVHARMSTPALEREGIAGTDYFFNAQGSGQVITEPQPAHARMSTPAMEKEGIAGTDYFFEPRGSPPTHESKDDISRT